MVTVTAEMRWFWDGLGPPGLHAWFHNEHHGCRAVTRGWCTDSYLADPTQKDLSLKRQKGSKALEVKGQVAANWGLCHEGPFHGLVEVWATWSSEALSLGGAKLIAVKKRRWVRTFDTDASASVREIALGSEPLDGTRRPQQGCNVEYAEVAISHSAYGVSLGLESFGPLDAVVQGLRSTAALLAGRSPPPLDDGWFASYPMWLQRHAA
jgi:hypothetical protein